MTTVVKNKPNYKTPKSLLTPMRNFLSEHQTSCGRFPTSDKIPSWKCVYLLGPRGPYSRPEEDVQKMCMRWASKNPNIHSWLQTPTAMMAPHKYILPELQDILFVTPFRFGGYFLPSYDPFLLQTIKKTTNNTSHRYKRLRSRFGSRGMRHLVAHCHGVPKDLLCEWSGMSESDLLLEILSVVEGFANTIPYWLWALRVDTSAISFTQKGPSRAANCFKTRLRTHRELLKHPQFVEEKFVKSLLPKYLHSLEALRLMPKRPADTQLSKYFRSRPTYAKPMAPPKTWEERKPPTPAPRNPGKWVVMPKTDPVDSTSPPVDINNFDWRSPSKK